MTLSVAELREHLDTELGDDALELLLDAAYEAIDDYWGLAGAMSELLHSHGDLLMLSRRALSITSVIERSTTLATNDYELRASGLTLRRLATGTNPASRWHGRVDVTYSPLVDSADRDRVAIDLVKLDENLEPGLTAESLGDWSETHQTGTVGNGDYSAQRAAILASLHVGGILAR